MEITEVIRITNLIKKVNCKSYALVSETAKELGVKKTALMQFIEDNPKLFTLVEVTEGKKNCGLGIRIAYAEPVLNPATDEWVEAKKKEWEKKIKVFEMSYYGCHEFYYLGEETKYTSTSLREELWRNTHEKIQSLVDAGLIKEVETCYGGFGDCSHWKGLLLTPDAEKALTEAGWELVY